MEIIFLPILMQYFYLTLKYAFEFSLFSEYPIKLTKKQAKTFFIPIVGIWFIIKDWYNNLPD